MWVIEPQGIRFLHVPDTFDGHFDGVPVISKGQQKVSYVVPVAGSLSGHELMGSLPLLCSGEQKSAQVVDSVMEQRSLSRI